MIHISKHVCVAALTAALAACGGGGGGGGSSSSSSSALTTPPATKSASTSSPSVPSDPANRSHAIFVPNISTNVYSVTDRTVADGVASTTTTANTSATYTTSGTTIGGLGLPTGTVTNAAGTNTDTRSYTRTEGTVITTVIDSRAGPSHTAPLTDSSYGVIYQTDTASGSGTTIVGYHQGTPTPLANMPTNITATYDGTFIGAGGPLTGSGDTLTGAASITANFGAGTVNGTIPNLSGVTAGSQVHGLTMNGTITGNTYKGTVAFTSPHPTTVTSSAMTGAFYGANANETAGALRIEGTIGPTPTAIVGGFGGKR
jgi:C-lobe and N-lobe beta barrels of Tf-binding protein B